jgi:Lrp/AsnC family transcriptional regulator, leucine-responsive regulatory protein
MELDAADRRILQHIQRNNRLTAAELGDLVGLSPSACHRRLAALRAARVIEAEIAVVDPRAVGRRITMIVTVTLEREHSDVITSFKQACRDKAEIMQCYYVTGQSDFVMVLTARSMEAYDAFVEDFLFANRNVRRFETMVVMDRVKVGFELPIEAD